MPTRRGWGPGGVWGALRSPGLRRWLGRVTPAPAPGAQLRARLPMTPRAPRAAGPPRGRRQGALPVGPGQAREPPLAWWLPGQGPARTAHPHPHRHRHPYSHTHHPQPNRTGLQVWAHQLAQLRWASPLLLHLPSPAPSVALRWAPCPSPQRPPSPASPPAPWPPCPLHRLRLLHAPASHLRSAGARTQLGP